MTILRSSTLSLTLAVVVFVFGNANPAFAEKPTCPGHPSCKPDPVDPTTYTIELKNADDPAGSVAAFAAAQVDAHEDGDFSAASDSDDLEFARPGGTFASPYTGHCSLLDEATEAACNTWDSTLADCENFFGPAALVDWFGPFPIVIPRFRVAAGNWSLQEPGGRRIVLGKIDFLDFVDAEKVNITLQLIGDCTSETPCEDPFVPEGSPSLTPLKHAWIIGKTAKRVTPRNGCVSKGSADTRHFPGGTESIVETDVK